MQLLYAAVTARRRSVLRQYVPDIRDVYTWLIIRAVCFCIEAIIAGLPSYRRHANKSS